MSETSHIFHKREIADNSGFNEQNNRYPNFNSCKEGSINTTNGDFISGNASSINTTEAGSNTGSSSYTAAFLLSNATIGAGIVNLPEAYQRTGNLAIAIIIHLIVCGISVISFLIVTYNSDKNQRTNYQDILLDFYGEKSRILSSVIILLSMYFYSIGFLVLIADQLEEFIIFINRDFYCTQQPWYMNRAFTTVVSTIIISPFCFYKCIKFLKYISIIGTAAFLYIAILVVVKYIQPHPPPGPVNTSSENCSNIIYLIVNIMVCYESQVCSVTIYSSMKHRTLREYSKVICVSFSVITIVYMAMAICGSLTFGSYVNGDILLSYENPDVSILIAVILVSVKLISSYTIALFPGRSAVRSLWCIYWKLSDEEAERKENIHNTTITLLWIVTSVLIAVIFADIRYFITFLGPLTCISAFNFPAGCLLRYAQDAENKKKWKYHATIGFCISFLILGFFILGLSLIGMYFEYSKDKIKTNTCKTFSASIERISNVTLL